MPLPLKRVKTGDKLSIPARDWNAVIDAARWVESQRRGVGGGPVRGPVPNSVIVRVKNSSGSNVAAGGILGISEPIFPPTTDPNADAILQIDLKGVTPTADHRGAFVVTLDPLKSNAIGRAVIAGVCWVKVGAVDAAAEDFQYAEVNASLTALKAAARGSARILYRQAGTGDKWALVKLGNEAGGTFPCVVESTSGSVGTISTAPTLVYTLKDPDTSDVIATGKSPLAQRVIGVHVAAGIGTYRYSSAGEVVLWWVDEVPDIQACTTP